MNVEQFTARLEDTERMARANLAAIAISDAYTQALEAQLQALTALVADVQAADSGPNSKRLAMLVSEIRRLDLIDPDTAARILDAHNIPASRPTPATAGGASGGEASSPTGRDRPRGAPTIPDIDESGK